MRDDCLTLEINFDINMKIEGFWRFPKRCCFPYDYTGIFKAINPNLDKFLYAV